ncbi:ABC transporter ATP-binding protein [Rhodovibrionaceae bacterium A322]
MQGVLVTGEVKNSQGKAQTQEVAVDIGGVTKIFGGGQDQVVALDNVSLSISENEFFTLLGPSGCGKTTLLRMIAGFEHPTSGEILLHGSDITALPPFKRPVNTVFQSYALFPHMTVAENIGFGLEMMGRSKAEVAQGVDDMLQLVQMTALKDRKTSQLSGGQQQRVALARALAPHPKVLLLDEPLSALDLKLRKEMQIELKRLQHETGITFIFVTHDQEEALTMSDRVAVMSAGKVRQVGPPREIYEHPADRFVADFIGETNFLSATLQSQKDGLAEVQLSSGKTIEASLPKDWDAGASKEASIVIRPEHSYLVSSDEDSLLQGQLNTIVYFGTDTHYHLTLETGEAFIVRAQNTRDESGQFSEGQKVGVSFGDRAAQVLRD